LFSFRFAFIEYWKTEDKEHDECCVICQPEYIINLILGFILFYEFGSEILQWNCAGDKIIFVVVRFHYTETLKTS